jgi:hypothetical protein
MKYAITGHTGGIGKRFFERLSPNVIGFSKSTGYDITSSHDRRRIINEVEDCDVFVNNASAGYGQTLLLIELFQTWKDQKKTIINIGSRIAEITVPIFRLDFLHYQSEKLLLREMTNKIQSIESECIVKYKWFGYVGTEKILSKYPHFTINDYITEDQAVDIILS